MNGCKLLLQSSAPPPHAVQPGVAVPSTGRCRAGGHLQLPDPKAPTGGAG